jgi:hypothetical protein
VIEVRGGMRLERLATEDAEAEGDTDCRVELALKGAEGEVVSFLSGQVL